MNDYFPIPTSYVDASGTAVRAPVKVDVKDYNNFKPVFEECDSYREVAHIKENMPAGTVVFTVNEGKREGQLGLREGETYRQTERKTGRQTDRKKGRHTNRQTDTD
mgnify:CR=1 FL=1